MSAPQLLDLLTNGVPHREVYHGRNGGWFVTYGGGEVSEAIVAQLYDKGYIVSVYSDCPSEGYHVGRTIDVQRTLKARKRGRDAPTIYVGDAPEVSPVQEG